MTTDTDKFQVVNPFNGICAMIICAPADATDEEILSACNRLNPSGTTHGWVRVARSIEDGFVEGQLPLWCNNDESTGRKHFIAVC